MKIFILLCFFVPGLMLHAQQFRNICTPGTTLFRGTDGYFKAFRCDSVVPMGNNDTLFISYRAIRDSVYNGMYICRDTTNGDALGRRIMSLHDGWFWFINLRNDTIRINTGAMVNDSWKFCNITDTSWLQAKVTEITTDTILGIPDIIKVITLQTKNLSGANIAGIFNLQTLHLSKSFGLTKTCDLYMAPVDTLWLTLIGKTNPAVGLQPFGWQEVYDFGVGDEFHISGFHYYGSAYVSWKMIKRIIEKTVYGNNDSVHYTIERCKKTRYPVPPPNTETIFDTVTEAYDFIALAADQTIHYLPDEFIIYNYMAWAEVLNVQRNYSAFNSRPSQIINRGGYHYDAWDSCYNDPFEHYGPVYTYVPGLGITNYSWGVGDIVPEREEEGLVYFKKGLETWGTPVATDCVALITHAENMTTRPVMVITPNPSAGDVFVTLQDQENDVNLQFTLYDSRGNLVRMGKTASTSFILERNGLTSGLYLLVLTGERGKFVGKSKIVFE